MIANIFLRLDPFICRRFSFREFYFYLPVFLIIRYLTTPFWVGGSAIQSSIVTLSSTLVPSWMETTRRKVKGLNHLLIRLFIVIFSFNLVSLFPYVLAYSAHLRLSVTLAIPLWLSLLSSGWIKNAKVAGGRLVPYGAPIALTPFLCVLETVRLFIRPVSLSLRLAVNIRAGHCFLSFIRQLLIAIYFSSIIYMMPILVIHVGYFILEIGISLIQAYIFTTLLALYSNDHPRS